VYIFFWYFLFRNKIVLANRRVVMNLMCFEFSWPANIFRILNVARGKHLPINRWTLAVGVCYFTFSLQYISAADRSRPNAVLLFRACKLLHAFYRWSVLERFITDPNLWAHSPRALKCLANPELHGVRLGPRGRSDGGPETAAFDKCISTPAVRTR
jgi:hypothetical protein